MRRPTSRDFGTRKTAAPGVRYAHQVVRPLHTLRKLPTLEAPFLAKAAALMRHQNESVRHAAAVIVLTRHEAAAERDAAYQLLAAYHGDPIDADRLDITMSHRDVSEQDAAAVAIRRRAASDVFRQPAAVHQLLPREVSQRQQGRRPDVDKLVRVFGGGGWRTKLGPVGLLRAQPGHRFDAGSPARSRAVRLPSRSVHHRSRCSHRPR